MKIGIYTILLSTIIGCTAQKIDNASEYVGNSYNSKIKLDTITYLDKSRNRKIPVATFQPIKKIIKRTLIIFSHGYGGNKLGENLRYNYLTKALAAKGNYVVSIQQELPSDPALPLTGNLQVERKPSWEKGADNIMYVIQELKLNSANVNFDDIVLIGHSQGGDMSALFQQKYPNIASKIITMDNRRMALPRTSNPKIYSLRASEFEADQGVIPTKQEQEKFNIKVITVDAKHSDMGGNQGTVQQKKLFIKIISSFLKD